MKQFMGIKEAVAATGLSEYYLRNQIRDNKIPYIKSGIKILINMPQLIEQLNADSKTNTRGIDDCCDK